MKRKVMIIGHARHGKDTVAEIMRDVAGYKFTSSSMAVCEDYIYPMLSQFYSNAKACYMDRVNNRDLWAALIRDYCTPDKARLGKLIFADNDIYVGCRDEQELAAVRIAFNPVVIWVDATQRKPLEPNSSMKLRPDMASVFIGNNDTEERLQANVKRYLEANRDRLGW